MGNRDVRNKEAKKPKKNAGKKPVISSDIISVPTPEVEVVKKRRKTEEEV
jgi:hypothetical protein